MKLLPRFSRFHLLARALLGADNSRGFRGAAQPKASGRQANQQAQQKRIQNNTTKRSSDELTTVLIGKRPLVSVARTEQTCNRIGAIEDRDRRRIAGQEAGAVVAAEVFATKQSFLLS